MFVSELTRSAAKKKHPGELRAELFCYGEPFEIDLESDHELESEPDLVMSVEREIAEELESVICFCDHRVLEKINAVNVESVRDVNIKLAIRHRFLRDLNYRLNYVVEKLTDKYIDLKDSLGDGDLREDIEELQDIMDVLDKIDLIQGYFKKHIHRIEKNCDDDISIYDSNLKTIQDLESRIKDMQETMISYIREQIEVKVKPALIHCFH